MVANAAAARRLTLRENSLEYSVDKYVDDRAMMLLGHLAASCIFSLAAAHLRLCVRACSVHVFFFHVMFAAR